MYFLYIHIHVRFSDLRNFPEKQDKHGQTRQLLSYLTEATPLIVSEWDTRYK